MGLENAPLNGEELGRKVEFAFFEAEAVQNFRHVAVPEQSVGREIFRHLHEMRLWRRRLAGSGDARFGIAHDAGRPVHPILFEQRPESAYGSRRIAAGIGNQASRLNPLAEQLRQPVDGLGQQLRMAVLGAVPTGVLHRSKPKRSAQIDCSGSLRPNLRDHLQRDFRRCSREHHVQVRIRYRRLAPRTTLHGFQPVRVSR